MARAEGALWKGEGTVQDGVGVSGELDLIFFQFRGVLTYIVQKTSFAAVLKD